ncbi:MAG TPA: tetratricopeptide repeat protein, partial [Phycisphaerales bacterium]|nr:tetratricopeptide repeat protein [Phycisphaerales bacterium]
VVAITLLAATGVSVAFGVSEARQRRIADEHVRIAEAEQETTAAMLRFMTDEVLAAGSVDRLGPRAMIGEALDAAMAGLARSFEGRPGVEARIRLAAARSFQDMGLFAQARENLDAADEIIRGLGDRRLALQQRLHHGRWLVDRGDPLAALAVFDAVFDEAAGRTDFDRDTRWRTAIHANPAHLQMGRADLSLARLEPLIEEAIATPDADPVVRWDLQSQACAALIALGRFEEVEPLLRAQLTRLDELPIGTASRLALTERNLGTVLARLGRLDEAEETYLVALERRRATFGDRHWRIAQIGEAFAELAELRRNMSEAERLRLEAIDTLRDSGHGSGVIVANHLNNLGMLYLRMGRLPDAEARIAEAIENAAPHAAHDNPHVLAFLHNLADVVLRQGRAAEALSIIDRAVDGRVRLYGDTHPGSLGTRAIRARALASLGRNDEAIAAYRMACNHEFTIDASVGPGLAEALFQFGLLLSRADLATEAEDAFRRLVIIYDQMGMHGHPFYPAAQSLHAAELIKLARFAQAETLLLDAFERVLRLSNSTPEQRERACLRLADLYEAWHATEPEADHAARAEHWRQRASEAQHAAPGRG